MEERKLGSGLWTRAQKESDGHQEVVYNCWSTDDASIRREREPTMNFQSQDTSSTSKARDTNPPPPPDPQKMDGGLKGYGADNYDYDDDDDDDEGSRQLMIKTRLHHC